MSIAICSSTALKSKLMGFFDVLPRALARSDTASFKTLCAGARANMVISPAKFEINLWQIQAGHGNDCFEQTNHLQMDRIWTCDVPLPGGKTSGLLVVSSGNHSTVTAGGSALSVPLGSFSRGYPPSLGYLAVDRPCAKTVESLPEIRR